MNFKDFLGNELNEGKSLAWSVNKLKKAGFVVVKQRNKYTVSYSQDTVVFELKTSGTRVNVWVDGESTFNVDDFDGEALLTRVWNTFADLIQDEQERRDLQDLLF